MKLKSDKITKGIIFAGCSFTWGQGLYYYSNLPTLNDQEDKNTYEHNLVEETHIEFMKSVRFPRLVANHFNTFELVHPYNGGSNDSIVSYWRNKLFTDRIKNYWASPVISVKDVSHLIFQCTQLHRTRFEMEVDGKIHKITYLDALQDYNSNIFQKWLDLNNLTLTEWQDSNKKKNMDMIKTFLQQVESCGIKTTIFTWPEENVECIKSDEWLNDRFMKIDYNGKTYDSMEQLMWSSNGSENRLPNSELVILSDLDNFEIPPKDQHPSKKLHEIMAENIINHLEKLKQKLLTHNNII